MILVERLSPTEARLRSASSPGVPMLLTRSFSARPFRARFRRHCPSTRVHAQTPPTCSHNHPSFLFPIGSRFFNPLYPRSSAPIMAVHPGGSSILTGFKSHTARAPIKLPSNGFVTKAARRVTSIWIGDLFSAGPLPLQHTTVCSASERATLAQQRNERRKNVLIIAALSDMR